MDFGLESFKSSQLGQIIRPIIEQNVGDMIAASKMELPAVQAIGKPLLKLNNAAMAENYSKQMVGRWVKELMEEKGWRPTRKARVSPGFLFSTGMIYNND